nr:hypothetical protein [Tanacetum cinerariifolium]
MESLNSDSQERKLHQLQQMQDNAKESCMTSFQILHSFLQVLSYDESKSKRVFERAFMTLFGQDNETFTSTMFLYVDLQNWLDKDEFQKDKSMAAFWVLNNLFQKFIDWQYLLDYDSEMTEKLFAKYTRIKVKQFRETLLLHMGNVKKYVLEKTRHKRQYDKRMKERHMQSRESKVVSSKALDASLVVTECSGTKSDEHITSSSSGTSITHVVDADIRPVSDQVPSVEVHLTAQYNVIANEKHHTNQSEPSYDTSVGKVTLHYFPNVRKFVFVNPNHVIASGSSRNSSKESYGSNDMAHNYNLEEAKKKTQDKNMNLKPSVMHTTSLQNTTNGSKPIPRSNNQTSKSLPVSKSSCGMSNGVPLVDHSRNSSSFSDSKHFVCSTSKKCVFNTNHDAGLTNFPIEVNSRIKVQSSKTRNNIKPVEKITNVIKPKRWISRGYRVSLSKSFALHEKLNTLRSCFSWKPTGKIFKTAGFRWIPTRNMFTDCTTKVDSEPLNGSNDDITNPYECDQTLNKQMASADNASGLAPQRKERCTLQCALSLKEEKSSYLRAVLSITSISSHARSVNNTGPTPTFLTPRHISLGIVPNLVLAPPYVPPTNKELEILFQPMFDEYQETPRIERSVYPALAVPVSVNSTGIPLSTSIDQDEPSLSHSLSSSALQSLCLHQGVVVESTLMDENLFAPIDNDPIINIFALEPTSEASSFGDASSAESTYVTQTLHYLRK